MKDGNITNATRKQAKAAKADWTRFEAMTEAQKHAAAVSDPDNRPLTEEDMNRMKRAARPEPRSAAPRNVPESPRKELI